ncbi:hypothetical protein TD95_004521 [Thielaviopsis punctulata]|uniref:ubiquitinyl hydrolase 1 n=1 Tax=Thielaviopsis punctulata TaxID=72032 RepID=A0A0F4Z756_9PEZI|nr:hypothetical protein TD95_004521 [Thielaviopsis punctulata]
MDFARPNTELDHITTPSASPNSLRKRKAEDGQSLAIPAPNEILTASLEPLSKSELEEWPGWIEVESDPAFFNAILRDLGVKNVRAQEVFSMDDLAYLGNTVFGLIFLSEFVEDDHETETECNNVWFANQTADNSCATVAMLNLLMNSKGANLGDKLSKFKESTKYMNTVMRGKYLSKDPFLRTTHNQFAHRMDILNADLALDNDTFIDTTGKRILGKQTKTSRSKLSAAKKRKTTAEATFHFVAYVKCRGEVWELDGLRWKPVSLGKVGDVRDDDDVNWLSVVKPIIESRMQMSPSGNFSLLSVVEDPLWAYSLKIATAMASLNAIDTYIRHLSPTWDPSTQTPPLPTPLRNGAAADLDPYKLTCDDIANTDPDSALKDQLSGADMARALALRDTWAANVESALVDWSERQVQLDHEAVGGEERSESFLSAVHEWARALAELDELQGLNALVMDQDERRKKGR